MGCLSESLKKIPVGFGLTVLKKQILRDRGNEAAGAVTEYRRDSRDDRALARPITPRPNITYIGHNYIGHGTPQLHPGQI